MGVLRAYRPFPEYLSSQAEDLQPRFHDLLPSAPSLALIPSAIRSLLLTELLEALLSGFDLNLYDGEEWSRVWWVAERLCGRLQEALETLAKGQYVEAKVLEVKGLKEMCRASLLVSELLFVSIARADVCNRTDDAPPPPDGTQVQRPLPRLR